VSKRPFVILDRDGTLIENIPYLSDYKRLRINPGVIQGLKALSKLGFAFGIVSNQSGVGRGLVTYKQLLEINSLLINSLLSIGVNMEFFLCCFHPPLANCECRKPKVGMIEALGFRDLIDENKSFMIGDSDVDVAFACSLGVTPILLGNSRIVANTSMAEICINATNFSDAVARVKHHVSTRS